MMKLKLKVKWGPETHLQLPIIAIGAAKDNEMKIFEIMTLTQKYKSSLTLTSTSVILTLLLT